MKKISCVVTDIKYSGGSYDVFPIKTNAIGKLLAADAVLSVDEYVEDEFGGNEKMHLKNYGAEGWLIEEDIYNLSPGNSQN